MAADSHPADFIGADQIKTVVRWRHFRHGQEAHCLVRLIAASPPARVVAVVSEIRSNPEGAAVVDDFANVAEAVIETLGARITVPPADIVWVAHHGSFSYWYSPGPETFTRVGLLRDDRYRDGLDRHDLLDPLEVAGLLGGADLEPVPQVLAELGWTY